MLRRHVKSILNIAFLLTLIALTLYFLLKDQELALIGEAIKSTQKGYLVIGLVLVLLFVCSESVIIKYLMHSLNYTVSLIKCIKYSFIGFFFSCITPSASGGQPAQVYYMGKDKLDMSVSTLVLLYLTIAYKGVLIMISGAALIFQKDFVLEHLGDVKYILLYGIIINVCFISFLLIIIFKGNLAKRMVVFSINFLAKIKIIRDKEAKLNKAIESMNNYKMGAEYLKKNPMVTINMFLITFFQRICLFLVTYVVYKSFGLSGISAVEIVVLQTIISLAVDMLPLPGGIGASETSFLVMFATIFGEKFLMPGMLLSRGLSYYTLVLLSGIVTVIAHLISHRKE